MVDKGYQGAAEWVRAIHPKKKKPHRMLSLDDTRFNQSVSWDHIIIENYFGRMCSLWAVLSHRYRWNEEMYDKIFKLCAALTNMHIKLYPLRVSDQSHFNAVRNRLYTIGEENLRKRQRAQERYRNKRRQRMSTPFRSAVCDSDATVSD